MKKKAILSIPVPIPSGKDYEVIAAETDIKGEKHLLIDLFAGENQILRWAFTDKEFSRYIPDQERWSKMGYYGVGVDGRRLRDYSKMHVYAGQETEKLIHKRCRRYADIVDCIFGIEKKNRRRAERWEKVQKANTDAAAVCRGSKPARRL